MPKPKTAHVFLEDVILALKNARLFPLFVGNGEDDAMYPYVGYDIDTSSIVIHPEKNLENSNHEWLKHAYAVTVIYNGTTTQLGTSDEEGRIAIPLSDLVESRRHGVAELHFTEILADPPN